MSTELHPRTRAAGYRPGSAPATAAGEAGPPSAIGSLTSTADTARVCLPFFREYDAKIDMQTFINISS